MGTYLDRLVTIQAFPHQSSMKFQVQNHDNRIRSRNKLVKRFSPASFALPSCLIVDEDSEYHGSCRFTYVTFRGILNLIASGDDAQETDSSLEVVENVEIYGRNLACDHF